jgi:serine/threonine protein phosphatase 1
MRSIAVSDIHGCLRTFRKLLEDVVQFTRDDQLFLLGDYVDRGPDSKGVLDYIMDLPAQGYKVQCLKGNHEDMLVRASTEPTETAQWIFNGGQEALDSFGANDPTHIPGRYLEFVKNLDFYIETGNYLLVHAGLNFVTDSQAAESSQFLWRVHNPLADKKAMLWIRNWYNDIDWNWLKDRVIIHGHTPVTTEEIWDMYDHLEEDQILDIDNGCFAKHRPGYGKLVAFDMTNRRLHIQDNID